jgi:hypothetical protein
MIFQNLINIAPLRDNAILEIKFKKDRFLDVFFYFKFKYDNKNNF